MENGKQSAFATASDSRYQAGLTKREYFAILALQGICIEKYVQRDDDRNMIAQWSVKMADALLEELEKTK
jgi:hypothetical protein